MEALEVEGRVEDSDPCGRTFSVSLRAPRMEECRIFFRSPDLPAALVPAPGNVAAIAALFPAMRAGLPLHVRGLCCPVLLESLEEFSKIWHFWKPDRYQPIALSADAEEAQPSRAGEDGAVFAFSGGVDSTFTLLRHCEHRYRRANRRLVAGVLVHGGDVPLANVSAFAGRADAARSILDPLGLPLRTVATDHRAVCARFGIPWVDHFGATFAAALHLFAADAGTGLFSTGDRHYHLTPIGSNALTDRLLGSNAFRFVPDGGEFTRTAKVAFLAEHPDIVGKLRVCWEGPDPAHNCGVCEKCIRTALNFRLAGLDPAPCFPRRVTDAEVRAVAVRGEVQALEFQSLLAEAERTGRGGESWVGSLRARLRAYARHGVGPHDAWSALRMKLGLRTRFKQWRAGE